MGNLDKEIEEQVVNIFKLGTMDALGGRNKPDPMPAVREAGENIKQAFVDNGWIKPTDAKGHTDDSTTLKSNKPSRIVQILYHPKWGQLVHLDDNGDIWTVRSRANYNEWYRVRENVREASGIE